MNPFSSQARKSQKILWLILMVLALIIIQPDPVQSVLTSAPYAERFSQSESSALLPSQLNQEANAVQESIIKAQVENWGLGTTFISYVGNNRAYEWYVDQGHTGTHSGDNCGPSCIEMVGKWAYENFDVTAEMARKKYHSTGGWWTTDDILSALERYQIEAHQLDYQDVYTITNAIDAGNLVIICNDMSYIPYESNSEYHVGAFYQNVTGHFIVVKGYVRVDTKLYYEVYDPNNWDLTYTDLTPKGKDRYYEASVVETSLLNWFPHVIIVKQPIER